MKDRYFFGRTLARQVDYFAFPRTGSHFFNYCASGLFDLVALPAPSLDNPEAVRRQEELDPAVLYALDLREEGAPFEPVFINQRATGQHGDPALGEHPVILLIRDPMATVYSYYKAGTERWNMGERIPDAARWAQAKLQRFHEFYSKGLALLNAHPTRCLLLRYEELLAGSEPLHRLVNFVGVRPKLRPEFVHRMTRFDTITRPGPRTFYRQGDNDAWRRDESWRPVIAQASTPDMRPFGYEYAPGPVPI
jgi:hypothetical protein